MPPLSSKDWAAINRESSGVVGVSRSMWGVVLGRIISGSGGSAMNVVAALLITGDPLKTGRVPEKTR
jgi:hypothetical protein